jgi:hypothetical protein
LFSWLCHTPVSVVYTCILYKCLYPFCIYYCMCMSSLYRWRCIWFMRNVKINWYSYFWKSEWKIFNNIYHYILLSKSHRWGVLDKTLCDKVCQWLVAGQWFSPVSSTNTTDRHEISEILLKVALNTIPPIKSQLSAMKRQHYYILHI